MSFWFFSFLWFLLGYLFGCFRQICFDFDYFLVFKILSWAFRLWLFSCISQIMRRKLMCHNYFFCLFLFIIPRICLFFLLWWSVNQVLEKFLFLCSLNNPLTTAYNLFIFAITLDIFLNRWWTFLIFTIFFTFFVFYLFRGCTFFTERFVHLNHFLIARIRPICNSL